MKFVQLVPLLLALALCLAGGVAHAKADTVALYTEAVMTGDVAALQKGIPVESEERLDRLLEDFGA